MNQKSMSIIICVSKTGDRLSFIHNDKLMGLTKHGRSTISRASFVEPSADNKWTADMAPVGGPVLGPFDTRSEALDKEVKWLNENNLGRTTCESVVL
jgi:hypothetical protein